MKYPIKYEKPQLVSLATQVKTAWGGCDPVGGSFTEDSTCQGSGGSATSFCDPSGGSAATYCNAAGDSASISV